ncbi:hypothetical protein Rhopal_000641-T1 [Rhodotorula paludigena]|uniref:tRNA N(3)-methylcytidine methyltransferase n=1 Tax=Rhodotorula paludigena TaxID=86838 RepID=A0AAV5GDK5_9BASI|nr:hypothetical protein Rhopal_000641-T1 [Rhodotorula paludigena]
MGLSKGSDSAHSSTEPQETGTEAALPTKRLRKPRIVLEGSIEDILARNNSPADPAYVDKLSARAGKSWHDFYKNHAATPFFKDRHWTDREWPELARLDENAQAGQDGDDDVPVARKGQGKAVLEVGCGTGAFIYPLLERYPSARFVAFDFAKKAVELTQSHVSHDPSHCHVFQHDLTAPIDDLRNKLDNAPPSFGTPIHSFDIISCVFVLSALPPEKQARAVETLVSLLALGGSLLFRDYALHDAAQLRFHSLPSASYAANPSLLSERFYRRGDNTFTFFFTPEDIETYIASAVAAINVDRSARGEADIEVEGKVEVVEREMQNRAEGWGCTRRFVHGSWRRMR